MKKVLFTIAAIMLTVSAIARPTGFNVGGGVSFNFMNEKAGSTSESQTFVGPYVEVGYDLKFSPVVGLYFGGRYDLNFTGEFEANTKTEIATGYVTSRSCVALPILFEVNIPTGKSSLFIHFGPTLDYWLTYRSVIASGSSTSSTSKSINWFEKNDSVNRFNVYLGGRIGVNIRNHVKVFASYDQSLINYYKKSDNIKNSIGQLRIGAAYVF